MALAVVGCAGSPSVRPLPQGPGVVLPAKIAEGEPQEAKPQAPPAEPETRDFGAAPDPVPLRLAEQWEFELLYRRGKVSLEKVRPLRFPKPVVTARSMGRFAVELWIGRELIERVRFDFPLLGSEAPAKPGPKPLNEPPTFAGGLEVAHRVMVPASPRATRAQLVDRATGTLTKLPWPPNDPIDPVDTVPAAPPATPGKN